MKLREKTNLSHRLYIKLQSFFFRKKEKKTAQNSMKCQKANPFLIDTKKRAKIDALLNDLARRDALVNAGKMQFLNFFDVKTTWAPSGNMSSLSLLALPLTL